MRAPCSQQHEHTDLAAITTCTCTILNNTQPGERRTSIVESEPQHQHRLRLSHPTPDEYSTLAALLLQTLTHHFPANAAAITRKYRAQSRSPQRSLHPCDTSVAAARMSRSTARGWELNRYHLCAVVKPAKPYCATSSHALAACLGYDEEGCNTRGCSAPAVFAWRGSHHWCWEVV